MLTYCGPLALGPLALVRPPFYLSRAVSLNAGDHIKFS